MFIELISTLQFSRLLLLTLCAGIIASTTTYGSYYRHSALCASYLKNIVQFSDGPLMQQNPTSVLHDMRAFTINDLGIPLAEPRLKPVRYADERSSTSHKKRVANRIRGVQLSELEQKHEMKTKVIYINNREEILEFINNSKTLAYDLSRNGGSKAYIYVNAMVPLLMLLTGKAQEIARMSGDDRIVVYMIGNMFLALAEYDATVFRWIPKINFTHQHWLDRVQSILTKNDFAGAQNKWAFASFESELSSELIKNLQRQGPLDAAAVKRHYRTENAGQLFRWLDTARYHLYNAEHDSSVHPTWYSKAMPQQWISVDLLFQQNTPSLAVVVRTAQKRPPLPVTAKEPESAREHVPQLAPAHQR